MTKPARVDYVLVGGQEVHLSVNFWGIKMLRGKEKTVPGAKEARQALNTFLIKGSEELDTFADALYGAYLIGLYEEDQNAIPMAWQEFEQKLGDDFGLVFEAVRYLLDPKQRRDSGDPSNNTRES